MAVACDITSAELHQNVWHLYRNKQSLGPAWHLQQRPQAETRDKGTKPVKNRTEGCG